MMFRSRSSEKVWHLKGFHFWSTWFSGSQKPPQLQEIWCWCEWINGRRFPLSLTGTTKTNPEISWSSCVKSLVKGHGDAGDRAHPNHRHRLDHDAGSNYQRKHEALGQWNSQHPTQGRCDLLYMLKQRQMRDTLKGSPELHLQTVRSQSLRQKPLFWSFVCTHGPALSGSFNLGII